MRFQTPLVPARLIRRYKRFLADCLLEDGREVTAHVANPGSMLGLKDEGLKIWLEPNDDPRKKLKWAWRLIEHPVGQSGNQSGNQSGEHPAKHFTGVDTSMANRVLKTAFQDGKVPGFDGYAHVRPEVKYGTNSRIDFLLTGGSHPDTYVEVKSVTLSRQTGLAEFHDSVTARGAKHLAELAAMAQQGQRAVMLYLVMRTDCTHVKLASDIDPAYAAAFQQAQTAGVEATAISCQLSPHGVSLKTTLPFTPP
jgi:sugar fermentation stimulation protein A